ncbi:hypothetical protein ACHAWF_017725 [Thalassiosira exigua]
MTTTATRGPQGPRRNGSRVDDPPPPPPPSGTVPSPASGVRVDGRAAEDDRRLRHRHHRRPPPPPPPLPLPTSSRTVRASHSLDDADIAAGAFAAAPLPPPRHHSGSQSMVTASLARAAAASPASRSLDSRTPEHQRQRLLPQGGTASNHPYQQLARNFFASEGSSAARHGSAPTNTNVPPRHRGSLKGAYGSEHDFLVLPTASENASLASSCSSSSSLNDSSRSLDRPRDGRGSDGSGADGRGVIPPLPRLDLIAEGSTDRAGTYPPYGLPTIEGSPAMGIDAQGRKRALSAASAVPPPPLSPARATEHAQAKRSRFVVLGWDLSSFDRRSQFLISAGGTFGFSLLYGYLQELISVELCHRKLGLFLALAQFSGYTILSYFFRNLERGAGSGAAASGGGARGMSFSRRLRRMKNWGRLRDRMSATGRQSASGAGSTVPLEMYLGLSVLRAIDLGMTNLAMQYVNYPAKTLMKSTRVVFTMIFGVLVSRKRYGAADYAIVGLMVAGLATFMHADAHSSAVFQPLGMVMLTVSLLCDGAIGNLSEAVMNRYGVGQDEFIFRLYSVATAFIFIAAGAKGDLRDGLAYLARPGTLQEIEEGSDPTWTVSSKLLVMALFSTTGFLGSSCSAAITKSFGALTMSITSTARKATTIFLSFALFPNECTWEHVGGIVLFVASLVAKSLRASRRKDHHHHDGHHHRQDHHRHHHNHGRRGSPHNVVGDAVMPPPVVEVGGGVVGNNYDGLIASPHRRRNVVGDDAV